MAAQPEIANQKQKTQTAMFVKNPGFKRLAYVAGIPKLGHECYRALSAYSLNYLHNVLKTAIIYMEHVRKSTISTSEIDMAFRHYGLRLYGGDCGPAEYFCVLSLHKKTTKGKMREYNQHSTKLFLSRKPLLRKMKEVANEYKTDVRFSSGAIDMMQTMLEDHLVALLMDAACITAHRRNKTVSADDIILAQNIKRDPLFEMNSNVRAAQYQKTA